MLTPRGFWFLVVVVVLLTAALWTSAATLMLICLTLLAWFLGSWLFFAVRLRLLAGRLWVERELCDERGPVASLWAGRTFRVRVLLRGAASPYLRVSDRVPYGGRRTAGEAHAEAVLAANGAIEIEYDLECPAAGRLRFEGLALQAADLQGFFYQDLFVQDVRLYRVLPALADARGHVPTVKRHNLLPLLGAHRHPRPGSGSELLDLRDYLPGDPPRTIAWKVSARRDRLMTKEFESEVPVRCTFFVDTSQSVRVGTPGQNALARLVEITASVAQATAGARDLTGLCLFDERLSSYTRPARGARHLVKLLNLLAEVADLPPSTGEAAVEQLLPLAYSFTQEVYPQLLRREVNHFPFWLPLLAPQPAWALRRPRRRPRSLLAHPLLWLRRSAGYAALWLRQEVGGRLSSRARRLYRWRKQLAAVLSVHYGLAPGGLALLLEDDEQCVLYLQRILAEHHVPYGLPYYDREGRYLFGAPEKVDVLARGLLHAVGRAHDNELFLLLADLLEVGDRLAPLLSAVKVALARHHQVMVVCPWPPGMPLPPRKEKTTQNHHDSQNHKDSGDKDPIPLFQPSYDSVTHDSVSPPSKGAPLEDLVSEATVLRFHQAYQQLRSTFGRLRVPVLCARSEESVPLILERLERLRLQERGVR